jgi:hypothetical protein
MDVSSVANQILLQEEDSRGDVRETIMVTIDTIFFIAI